MSLLTAETVMGGIEENSEPLCGGSGKAAGLEAARSDNTSRLSF